MAEFTKTVTVNYPYCQTDAVIKHGVNGTGHQRYKCKKCAKRFLDTGAIHGRKAPSNHIGAAIDLFYSGMSYKQMAEFMAKSYDIAEPSKETL